MFTFGVGPKTIRRNTGYLFLGLPEALFGVSQKGGKMEEIGSVIFGLKEYTDVFFSSSATADFLGYPLI